ncbi:saccharopine dehydrogenase NADP-binding domain-containing protein [Flavisphingomonas formosensis]|uniref:saccharopine dehydrogenase NADP-binding domain-containing protein n=1 Tax=Flavisphingomonas formosensis TaxID=861534 RepID=UPI0012FBA738|nr:saccharopine dehydrogenase NADP-binding domain-containing protein [Sphingomonas formosensis]
MSRILVLGGYGGFGARLSRRLAARGHAVLVAGRRGDAAAEYCRSVPGATPVAMNRNGNVAQQLAGLRPDLLIDAAGPFQASGYQVVQACIDTGVPYLDLADGRDFVGGIAGFDAAARAAGVAVISGASSVPALSGAVARSLAADMARVSDVESVISASNRATAGLSVATAILSYVGQPVRLWSGAEWETAYGWQSLRRQAFALRGKTLFTRWVALAEVPDHAIVPAMLPGEPRTVFRAGPEFAFQTIGLWLLSWPVRWRLLSSIAPLAPHMRRLHGLTAGWGGDRSAMAVTVDGWVEGRAVRRRWTLVADRGDGPEIPTMAAELLAEMIVEGRLLSGAGHAATLLALDQFAPLFADRAITTEIVEEPIRSLRQR